MTERRLNRALTMLLAICLMLPLAVAFADEDAAEMNAYWRIVGNTTQTDPLTRAMNGDYASVTLSELKAVTTDDLLAFAMANRLPVAMARYAYYTAMADRLNGELPQTALGERLALFLAMKDQPKDKTAKEQRRDIRKATTEADINAYAAEIGLPAGFLAWLMLDDEWYEVDWEEGDDWREDRRTWDFADWVDESDLRDRYGKEAVVTEDDVERVLWQNGLKFDD
nr:hypothetical protein [Clostridia bacterium]